MHINAFSHWLTLSHISIQLNEYKHKHIKELPFVAKLKADYLVSWSSFGRLVVWQKFVVSMYAFVCECVCVNACLLLVKTYGKT